MKRYILITLTILIIHSIHSQTESDSIPKFIIGERIDGPANVRDTINGKILFELKDCILVETTPIENNWLKIGLHIKFSNENNTDFFVSPNKKLFSESGNLIGKTINKTEILFKGDNYAFIYGYTYKDNIKLFSNPEYVLSELINQNKLSKIELNTYMNDFKFEKSHLGKLDNIEQYSISQSLMIDISPRDRITMLFKNDLLVGFVHSREIDLENFKSFDLIRGHKLTITSDLKNEEIEEIINNKINVYNSID